MVFLCVLFPGEKNVLVSRITISLTHCILPVYLHAFFTLQLTYFFQLISREGEITTKQWELVCKYMSNFLWLSIKFLIKISFNYLHVFFQIQSNSTSCFSDTIKFYLQITDKIVLLIRTITSFCSRESTAKITDVKKCYFFMKGEYILF